MEAKVCPVCETINSSNSLYCSNCGYNLATTDIQKVKVERIEEEKNEEKNEEDITKNLNFYINTSNLEPQLRERVKLWTAYVQERSEYYIPKFILFHTIGKKASWNWAAFFFPFYWSLYRKNYPFAALLIIPLFIFNLPTRILMGIFGNYIYYKKVEKEVNKALQESKYLNLKPEVLLMKRGGTSVAAIFIGLFLVLMAFSIIASVVGEG